ncbi:MAG: SUMF1/EgtB/PvdO family nonheme iron enzyme, partial [Acidobacteria bacterium]|nr:SUMF1/EgtB/PvdO family nonheme iron enzyme [Acidobacteriota bacterium]
QGRYGDTFAGPVGLYTLTNQSASGMEWDISADRDWLDVAESLSDEVNGTVAGLAELTFDVELNELADAKAPGTHTATVMLRNITTGKSQTREVKLTIDQPIQVTALDPDPQEFSGLWGGPFDTPASRSFDLVSDVDFDLDYLVGVDQPWLTVEPQDSEDQLTGTLPAAGSLAFIVTINNAADALPVGEFDGAVRFTFTDTANDNLSDTVEQAVKLIVLDPVVITETFEPWNVGPVLDPESLPSQVYTVANDADIPIEVLVDVDADWVDLDTALVEVLPGPGHERPITASLNDNVLTLFDGEYVATLTFENTTTGIIQCRNIELTIVEDLSVAPFADFAAAGIAGGPIGPPFKIYTLTNVARDGGGPIDWEVFVQNPTVDWILINGGPATGGTGGSSASGTLADGESVNVVVFIDSAQTASLAEGVHEAQVAFKVPPDGDPAIRTLSLTLVVPKFTLAESFIPVTAQQPGGPTYAYRTSTFHTTNTQFVAFLNDAMQHPTDERGRYMFFDTDSGDVYVNSSMIGAAGAGPGSRTIKMFSPAAAGRIELSGGAYAIVADAIDYSRHPVTGVSWYGAVKFCNWLTIDRGMLPGQRCYTEDTDASPAGWHPVTISTADWLTRNLMDDERLDLVTRYRGYRLPMDDGHNNADVSTDRADAYNEWYKAAAWNETLRQNTMYGFGRD